MSRCIKNLNIIYKYKCKKCESTNTIVYEKQSILSNIFTINVIKCNDCEYYIYIHKNEK